MIRSMSTTTALAMCLAAPLAPNRNHVGTAFGGSLQGLATLAGWAVTLICADGTRDAEVVVAEAGTQFIAPVTGELVATAPWPPPDVVADFRARLDSRGRARLRVCVELAGENGTVAADFSGQFVARRVPQA